MAIHLTPTELARESGLERRDVIVKCVEWGIPIFNGRIDKTLFLSSFREITGSRSRRPHAAGPARSAAFAAPDICLGASPSRRASAYP